MEYQNSGPSGTLKAYLCKLIQVNLFGVLAETSGRRKFWETESNPPNFGAVNGFPKLLADHILHSKHVKTTCLSLRKQ